MSKYSTAQLIKIVTDSFQAEQINDVKATKSLIANDFKQRGMFVSAGKIFPVFTNAAEELNLEDEHSLMGREFRVWNVAANEDTQTVFIELVEVELKDDSRRVWPYVLICQIDDDGKIKRSRHYGDPATLNLNISVEEVGRAVKD